VHCCNTFQFLDGEDTMLPALSYLILRMKTANGIKKISKPVTRMQCQSKILGIIPLLSVIITLFTFMVPCIIKHKLNKNQLDAHLF
jgi:hypothetical protein